MKKTKNRSTNSTERTPDVFFALDKELNYTFWNQSAERITGIPEIKVLGKSIFELFSGTPGLMETVENYRGVINSRKPMKFINYFGLNGNARQFEISVFPSKNGISVFCVDSVEPVAQIESPVQHKVSLPEPIPTVQLRVRRPTDAERAASMR